MVRCPGGGAPRAAARPGTWGSRRMTGSRADWPAIVLRRGVFGLAGCSPLRFLLDLVLWSVVWVAVAFGMLVLVLDGMGG